MQDVTTPAALAAALSAHPLLLVFYSAPGCGVCDALAPKVDAVLSAEGVPGVKVDTTELVEDAGQRLIFTVPTLLIFVEGREVSRLSRHISIHQLSRALGRARPLLG